MSPTDETPSDTTATTTNSAITEATSSATREDQPPQNHLTETEPSALSLLPPRYVYYHGTPFLLDGPYVGPGKKAPPFQATTWHDDNIHDVTSDDIFSDARPCILTTMHSVDTRLAISHAILLENAVDQLPSDNFAIYLITTDLPFTQNRFAREARLNFTTLLSDYTTRSFGKNYGVLVLPHLVLTRSVYVVDQHGYITYRELAEEINSHLNYTAAADALYNAITS